MIEDDKFSLKIRNENLELKAVVRMIKSGSNPNEISRQFPELFIEKGRGIIRLYEHINKIEWRFKE